MNKKYERKSRTFYDMNEQKRERAARFERWKNPNSKGPDSDWISLGPITPARTRPTPDDIIVSVCASCDEILNDKGLSIETKEEAESLAIRNIIRLSHGACLDCARQQMYDAGFSDKEVNELFPIDTTG